MSAEAISRLIDSPEYAAFLPVINYCIYVYTSYSDHAFLLSILAIFVSVFLYLSISGISSDDTDELKATYLWVFRMAVGIWIILLLASMAGLYSQFNRAHIAQEVMVFVSIGFLCAVIWEGLLKRYVGPYSQEL